MILLVAILCCLRLFGPKLAGNIVVLFVLTIVEHLLILIGALLFPAFAIWLFIKTR